MLNRPLPKLAAVACGLALTSPIVVTPRPRWQLALRANNLADTRYADRADFAFDNYRYFPGRGREPFLELRYSGDGD